MIELHLNLRRHQRELRDELTAHRFAVLVCHRRFGKTVLAVSRLLEDALLTKRPRWQGAYLAPTYRQAKQIAWEYLKAWVRPIPGVDVNEAELRVTLPHNGARIRLLSGESYDSLRGLYLDAAVLDETALMPAPAWSQVISPMLADREGWGLFIGTPAGRMNLFFELLEQAQSDETGEWFWAIRRASETGILPERELRRLQRGMSAEEYAQELECSFTAAIKGAYWGALIEQARQDGRVARVPYDPSLPVGAALDLGFSDATVAWFWQVAGAEVRLIDCRSWSLIALPEVVREMKALPHAPHTVIAPHDVNVRELSTGRSRLELMRGLGLDVRVAPNIAVDEGIEQVRSLLPLCAFDAQACNIGLEALQTYRAEFDEVRRVHKLRPLHDWSSHYADAFRMLAVARPDLGGWAPLDDSILARRAI